MSLKVNSNSLAVVPYSKKPSRNAQKKIEIAILDALAANSIHYAITANNLLRPTLSMTLKVEVLVCRPSGSMLPVIYNEMRLKHFLKIHPEFFLHAFNFARTMEQEGHKVFADRIRNCTIQCMPTSSTSPILHDSHFLSPPLTGRYPVGVTAFYLEDSRRNENTLDHNLNRTRHLEIDVYYPGIPNRNPSFRIDPNIENIAFPNPKTKEKFGNLWTRAEPGLKADRKEKFPVVIFSHGWGQNCHDYAHLLEELASHGYCVIALNHPYSNFVTLTLGHNQDQSQLEYFDRSDDLAKRKKIEREVLIHADDIAFVLKQLKKGTLAAFLRESINLESIGIFGHSLGGAAAYQACIDSPKIFKAGINLDGGLVQDPKKNTIHQPFLTIEAEHAPAETRMEWSQFQKTNGQFKRINIPCSSHADFTLKPFYGSIGQERLDDKHLLILRRTNIEILRFFNEHLKNSYRGPM